jgi:hypothetical protein
MKVILLLVAFAVCALEAAPDNERDDGQGMHTENLLPIGS